MKRERQARWDMNHLRTASTKLTVGEYCRLQVACEAEGMTVYTLLQKMLKEYLQDHEHAAEGWLFLPLPGKP